MTTPPVSQEAGALDRPFNADQKDQNRFQQPTPQAPGEPVQPGQQSASQQAMAAFGMQAPQQQATPSQTQPQPPAQGADPLNWFNPNQQGQPSQQAQQPTPEQQKANVNGQQVVDNYSKYIQDAAEMAYAAAEFNALNNPNYLEQMINSGDKLQTDLAKKVLERKSDQFGAKSIEEYQAKLELDRAGEDPTKRELAQIKMNQAKFEREQADKDWRSYKEKQKIEEGSEFDKICDAVRKEYPNITKADVIHTARGRSGIDPTKFGPSPDQNQGMPNGDRGGQSGGANELPSTDHMKAFGLKPGVAESAERYFGGLAIPGIQ